MTKPVRVLIVDDDALVRSGLTMMLGGADSVEVVGEAQDGSEVLGAIDRHRPDVLMLDLRMPKVDGLGTLALLRGQPQPPAVIVLTTFDTDEHVLQALRQGAAGFLVKDTPPAEIVRAIELVAGGESMLSPTVTRRLIDHLAADGEGDERRRAADQLRRLSLRDVADRRRRSPRASRTPRSRPSFTSASPRSRATSRRCWPPAAREPRAAGADRPGGAARLSGPDGAGRCRRFQHRRATYPASALGHRQDDLAQLAAGGEVVVGGHRLLERVHLGDRHLDRARRRAMAAPSARPRGPPAP